MAGDTGIGEGSAEYPVSWLLPQRSIQRPPTITLCRALSCDTMTSEQRREARYQRRKARREAKRRAFLDKYDNFNRAAAPSAIIRAHWDSRCGVLWKFAPALYDKKYVTNAAKSSVTLKSGKSPCQGFNSFGIVERGKYRDIHSLKYTERVVRRSFCINAFVPILSHNLIWDNGACLKNKGGFFAEKRLTAHLRSYYNTYHDNEGYVIVIDFSKYFANIDHEKLLDNISKYIYDDRLYNIAQEFISSSGSRGLYIGPEDSQIFAISYPNDIDHLIKDQWRLRWYGRYNDDSYIIVRDKEEAKIILKCLLQVYRSFNIIPNPKKTQIVKLSRGFTFLKIKWNLKSNGKIIRRPCRKSIVRQRRKLKAFYRFYIKGEMTLFDICQSYMSWRGYITRRRDSSRSVFNMDRLFIQLFDTKPWRKDHGKYGYSGRNQCFKAGSHKHRLQSSQVH